MKKAIEEKEQNTKHFVILFKKIFLGAVLISFVGFVAYTLLFLLMLIM